jgi:hypothetical protein
MPKRRPAGNAFVAQISVEPAPTEEIGGLHMEVER